MFLKKELMYVFKFPVLKQTYVSNNNNNIFN